jgi:hypothetical protein
MDISVEGTLDNPQKFVARPQQADHGVVVRDNDLHLGGAIGRRGGGGCLPAGAVPRIAG